MQDMWKTIVVPHDFSSSANHAAALARDEAKAHGGKLILLHAVDLPAGFGPDTTLIVAGNNETPIGMREFAVRRANEHLGDLAARLQTDGVEVEAVVKVGNAVQEILDLVEERGATAIVMGTHGRTGLKHLLAGSVAERIVRASPVPVLTTRHPED